MRDLSKFLPVKLTYVRYIFFLKKLKGRAFLGLVEC